MPHYEDGMAARVGDYVVGKGYNVKDRDGQLAMIAGVVIAVSAAEICNLTIAYPVIRELDNPMALGRIGYCTLSHGADPSKPEETSRPVIVTIDTEYGDTKGFRKVG